ncbi:MAG: M48 family peptidase [Candidatus Omnitrophota bacterium]|nr:MAG: M48 family peptidase [Candidatus Omnitrophota bacterium]
MKVFTYGQYRYEYELLRQERKSLSLTVCPDMGIVLRCPVEAGKERVEAFLRKKWKWLNKQLNFFKKFQRNRYEKEYISGESFLYLGRQYKLVVKMAKDDMISLSKGKLLLATKDKISNGNYNRKLIDSWYKKRAENIFHEQFIAVLDSFNYSQNFKLSIRKMSKRWGSFVGKNTVILNPMLVYVPKYCINYVIAHELCHVKYKHHNKKFYDLLTKIMPDWEKRKERLELLFV